MRDTTEGAVYRFLDRIYKTTLLVGDSVEGRPNMVVSLMSIAKTINPKQFEKPWTPFLETGELGDEDVPSAGTSPQSAAEKVANLVDEKIFREPRYQTIGTDKISTTWKAIVNAAQLSSQTQEALGAEDQARLTKARDLLYKTEEKGFVETSAYRDYKKYKRLYEEAQERYVDAYEGSRHERMSRKRWPRKGARLTERIREARAAWDIMGRRNDVEEAISVISAQGKNPTAGMIADAKRRFEHYHADLGGMSGETMPYSYISPTNWTDESAKIWNEYSGNFKSSETHHSDTTANWHAGLRLRFGYFRGGGVSGKMKKLSEEAGKEHTKISLEWTVVEIVRPWLDSSLLSFGGWYLKGVQNGKGIISSGSDRRGTYLPCIPVKLILVRNISVQNKALQSYFRSESKKVTADARIGFGFFGSVGADLKSDSEKRDAYEKMADEGLKIPGMRLIGCVSAVTPPSPQLDGPRK